MLRVRKINLICYRVIEHFKRAAESCDEDFLATNTELSAEFYLLESKLDCATLRRKAKAE